MKNSANSKSFWLILLIIIVVLIAVGGGAWWFLSNLSTNEIVIPDVDDVEIEAYGSKTVSLLYLNDFGKLEEQIEVLNSDGELESDLKVTLTALAETPEDESLITGIPFGAIVNSVFHNQADRSVVVDYSVQLIAAHPGGSAAEHATIDVIMTTIARNFPEIDTCYLLVDGAQCETLKGHIEINIPFNLAKWR